ncbi:MAG: family 10 glycosylhydrolase [Leptolyngbyaceae bacterium]|nr:family 10 glycosylhydrolase [Leptolyngbyaceae bacterium]
MTMWRQLLRTSMIRGIGSVGLVGTLLFSLLVTTAQAQTTVFCRLTPEAIAQKESLRRAAQSGDSQAINQYKALIRQHGQAIQRCRQQTWPQQQALWIRLYPCDAKPGAIEQLLDQVVNWGYNTLYVETFYNGQVLLPAAENTTPWPSVIRHPSHQQTDLLAAAIARGRERGLKVYSWMFAMNFGYSYAQRSDRQDALAMNGQGHTSLSARASADSVGSNEAFIDPYSPKAKQDYYHLTQAVLRRQPDGVLFDYIRYPRGEGGASIASRVQDLWIYGPSSQRALFNRATNQGGQTLMYQFLRQGYLTDADIAAIDAYASTEGDVQWQGRSPSVSPTAPIAERRNALQNELWRLSVAHAVQGVLDFLNEAVRPVQQRGIPAGAVFFPGANASVNSGYDSRLQPWERFPSNIEWHPMAYSICGDGSCVAAEVQQVLAQSASPAQVKPVLAGGWGRSVQNHPPLEAQMATLHSVAPYLQSVSHFAYSWQDPQSDNNRKFCNL